MTLTTGMARKAKRRRSHRRPLTRAEIMSRIRSIDTRPEMRVRRTLWAAGLRYRLHDRRLPGKPDVVFCSRRIVIFVHGCFWHGHQGCPRHRIPKTRTEWWAAKIARNRERDDEARRALEAAGWTVIVLWECEAADPERLERLVTMLKTAPFANGR